MHCTKTLTNKKKHRFSYTSRHDKKYNNIGMVVVGFVLQLQDNLMRLRWVYCCRACHRGLCGGGSVISAMVFVGKADF